MTFGKAILRILFAGAALGGALLGCSDRHSNTSQASPSTSRATPALSRAEVLEIARGAALRDGMKLEVYGSPQARYEIFAGKGRWVVFYPGIEDKPENFFN